MADENWVDPLIGRLEEAVSGKLPIKFNDETGKEVIVSIKQNLVNLIKQNRSQLQKVGRQTFKEFLLLWHKQEEFEALVVIFKKLDNKDLIERFKEDTVKLAEIAKETQESRDFWISFGKQVGMRIAFGAIGALL